MSHFTPKAGNILHLWAAMYICSIGASEITYEHYDNSNHQDLDCIFNGLFRLLALCDGPHPHPTPHPHPHSHPHPPSPPPPPPPTPNQSAYHARTQVWKIEKHPLSRILDEKKTPFFNRNRWFGGPIKHPFLSKTRFFRNKAKVTFFVKVRIYVTASNWRHFLCTSYFSLRLNYGKSSNTFMHNNSNMRKKQMVINAYKILPFFEILQTHVCKMIPFYWFREFAPPIEKIPPFSRKWVRAWYTFWSGVGGRGDGNSQVTGGFP